MSVLAISENRRGPYVTQWKSRLRKFLLWIDERSLDDDRSPRTGRRDDFDFGTEFRERGRHPRVSDVLLQSRRPRERREDSDLLPVLPNRPRMREPGPDDFISGDFYADEFPLRSFDLDFLQRRTSDEVMLLLEVDEPTQPGLVRVVFQVDVGRIVQDARLDPTVLGGTRGPEVEGFPGVHDPVPQVRAAAPIPEIDLVPDFGGPPRSRHEHRDAIDRRLQEVIVLEIQDPRTDERLEQRLRFRALDLHRRNIRFAKLDVEVRVVGDPFGPEEHVAVRGGEPEPVLREPREDRVVDETALLVRQDDVLRLAHLARAEVAGRQVLHELVPVGAADLHLSFASHVPDGHVIHEVPVFLDGIREIAWDVHLVVQVVRITTRALCGIEERRLPVPGPEVERRLSAFDDHAMSPHSNGMRSAYLTPAFEVTKGKRSGS